MGWKARRLALAAAALPLVVVAADLSRPPEAQATAAALLAGIDLYQRLLSPWMPRAGIRCRFTPTCSLYAEAVIRRHGALGGSWRALGRLLRCGPWTPPGTEDPPVPGIENSK